MIPVPSGTVNRVGLIGDVHGAEEALRQALAFLAFLSSLPPSRSFQTPRGLVLLCHAVGDDDMSGVYRNAGGDSRDRWLHLAGLQKLESLVRHYPYRLIVSGHTHRYMAEQHGEAFLINAGTLLSDKEPPTVSVIDFAAGEVRFFGLDVAAQTVAVKNTCALP